MASLADLGRSARQGGGITGALTTLTNIKTQEINQEIALGQERRQQAVFDEKLKQVKEDNAPVLVTDNLLKSMFPNMTQNQVQHAMTRWKALGFVSEDEQGRRISSKRQFREGMDFYTNFQKADAQQKQTAMNDLIDSARIKQADLQKQITAVDVAIQKGEIKKPEDIMKATKQKEIWEKELQGAFRSEKMLSGELAELGKAEEELSFADKERIKADEQIRIKKETARVGGASGKIGAEKERLIAKISSGETLTEGEEKALELIFPNRDRELVKIAVNALRNDLDFQGATADEKAQMIDDLVESLQRDTLNENIEGTNEGTKTLTFDKKTGTFK
jgi:hypothetical protein